MKEILISSSVLILALVLLRSLLRGKVSRRLQYGLWLLVALRLLIPVSFGQSDYSVTTLTNKIEQESKPIQQIQESLREPIAGPSRAEIYEQLLNEYLHPGEDTAKPEAPEVQMPVTPAIREQLEEQVDRRLTAPTASEMLTAVWIGGMGIMALWFIAVNLAFLLRAKRGSALWEGTAPVTVRISPNVPTPCLTGLFRPVIYLTPASVQDENALDHILTHELTHLRHADHIWSLVRCVCLCVYWFDPLVWLAATLSKRDCELACDETALKKLGDDQRIPYGKTLLATVTPSRSPAHILETATAMNETKKQLKERVNQIVKKPRTFLIAAVILILTAAIAVGCTFTGSKPTEPSATEPPVTQPTEPAATEPTLPPPVCPTDPTVAPLVMTEPKAKFIAQEAIGLYFKYRTRGICCDTTYVYEDLSQFLTDAQKKNYDNSQLLLKCCHTPEEVRQHIGKNISPALIDSYPDDRLFSDNEGNLYLLDAFQGNGGYSSEMTITHYSDEQIIATKELFSIDDTYYGSQIYTLTKSGSSFILENFEWYSINISNLPYSDDTFAERRQSSIALAMEHFGLSYIEFLYAGNTIVSIAAEDYATQTATSVPWDTEAMCYRSLYIGPEGKAMLNFPIRGIGNTGDPLSGFFAREFSAPEQDISGEAYRWFFEELPKNAGNLDTYTKLVLEALYSQPEAFLRNVAELDNSVINGLTARIYASLTKWDDYETFVQFLATLSDKGGWTKQEARVLKLLSTPPDSYTAPDNTPEIVRDLLDKYRRYELQHIFCDFEHVSGDMSQYLTDKQKEEYWDYQYRITCCDTIEEVKAHARRMLGSDLFDSDHSYDDLFYDDEGNLYRIILPTGYSGYHNERILGRTDTQIIAFTDYGYDDYEYSAAFALELRKGEWTVQQAWSFDERHTGHNSEEAAYRWLFEEMHNIVDGNYADSYAELLTDALFVEPDTFLRQLSKLDKDRIESIADFLHNGLTDDEKEVYDDLLKAMAARIGLTDQEQAALSVLQGVCQIVTG